VRVAVCVAMCVCVCVATERVLQCVRHKTPMFLRRGELFKCVCVCVYVRKRAKERERESVCVWVYKDVYKKPVFLRGSGILAYD